MYQVVIMTHNGDVAVEEFDTKKEAIEYIEDEFGGEKVGRRTWFYDNGQMLLERR